MVEKTLIVSSLILFCCRDVHITNEDCFRSSVTMQRSHLDFQLKLATWPCAVKNYLTIQTQIGVDGGTANLTRIVLQIAQQVPYQHSLKLLSLVLCLSCISLFIFVYLAFVYLAFLGLLLFAVADLGVIADCEAAKALLINV